MKGLLRILLAAAAAAALHAGGFFSVVTGVAVRGWMDQSSIFAVPGPPDGGSVMGTGQYPAGREVRLTAVPQPGFLFRRWSEDGQPAGDAAELVFRAAGDRRLTAEFAREVELKTLSLPADAGELTGAGRYAEGAKVTLGAMPKDGFRFERWLAGTGTLSTDPGAKIEVREPVTVTAQFVPAQTITAAAMPEKAGRTEGAGRYAHGETVTLRVKVPAGSAQAAAFTGWTENGEPVSKEPEFSFVVDLTKNREPRHLVAHFEMPDQAAVEIPLAKLTEALKAEEERKKREAAEQQKVALKDKGGNMIFAPEGPDEKPLNADTKLQSSRDMQAASEMAPVAGGDPNLPSQVGIDLPEITLMISEFQAGDDTLPEKLSPVADAGDPAGNATPDTPMPDIAPAPPRTETVAAKPPAPKEEPVDELIARADRLLTLSGNGKPISLRDDEDTPPERRPAERPPEFRAAKSEAGAPAPMEPEPDLTPMPRGTAVPKETRTPAEQAAFSSERKKTTIRGGLSIGKKGPASVDAKGTPEARYGRAVSGAIETEWRRRMLGLKGYIAAGVVEIEFEVDAQGKVHNARVVESGNANAIMEDCGLTAVQKARLPTMSADLRSSLEGALQDGRYRTSMTFYIY